MQKDLSIDLDTRITKLNQVARSWVNYFKIGDMKNFPLELSAHIRTMLRIIIWKQWKVPGKRQWGLQKLAINKDLARQTSYMRNRYYFVATKTCVRDAISLAKLKKKGLVDIYEYYEQ